MIRTLKWAYKLGQDSAHNELIRILEQERDFHLAQSQIKSKREFEGLDTGLRHRVTPDNHEQRRRAIEDALHRIDPEAYPDTDKMLELLS